MKRVRSDALSRVAAAALAGVALLPEPGAAQQQPPGQPHPPHEASESAAPAEPEAEKLSTLRLSAMLAANDHEPVRSGLIWRVFEESAQPDGSHKLVTQSEEATPTVPLRDGAYIVHAAYGLAGVTRRVAIEGSNVSERVVLNAGGLKLIDKLGDAQIPAQRLSISIYVPERGNAEAKLILANAKSDEVICLPEGAYHVVSTLLDTGQGAQNQTNSVVTADLKVPAGKLIEATLRHRAAIMTLKLVKQPGGEALANTSFSVLTPGGDVIRELIGAFPSLVLAEGEYVAIARHEGKTYQGTFRVQSTRDADVEILMRDQPRNHAEDERPQ
ncbi:MAG: hypothetical protein AB7F41_06280 [Methylocystis sp.]|uniref:hypothetical protein n=1 Tax=Methylocystis sp. TaxID=1911079 RepID=UPI003D0A9AE0